MSKTQIPCRFLLNAECNLTATTTFPFISPPDVSSPGKISPQQLLRVPIIFYVMFKSCGDKNNINCPKINELKPCKLTTDTVVTCRNSRNSCVKILLLVVIVPPDDFFSFCTQRRFKICFVLLQNF